MKLGIKAEKNLLVESGHTAKAMGSGDLEVFSTPSMIALMEGCAAESVAGELEEGMTTVGTHIAVEHLAATPMGMKVVCKSTLEKVDGRALRFSLEVYDECGLIGKGEHDRFIVPAEKFLKKTYEKLKK